MNFSDSLLNAIQQLKKPFPINLSDREDVIENLKFLHDCCAASEELLLNACSHASPDLADYYLKHYGEEKGELPILTEDLRSAGIVSWHPNPIAMAMIGTQYYLIKHVHPVALLGYMAVQEGDPTSIEIVEKAEALHGADLFRFIRMHAIKDQEHRKELIEVIDGAGNQELITFSARSTLEYLGKAMRDIYGGR